jgi:hypothetical protein
VVGRAVQGNFVITLRRREAIHVQAESKDRDRTVHTVGTATALRVDVRLHANVQRVCRETTKYTGKGVPHDFPRGDADFHCT